jgi:hypothetical protein
VKKIREKFLGIKNKMKGESQPLNLIERKELFVSLNEIWTLIDKRKILYAKIKLQDIIDTLREEEEE